MFTDGGATEGLETELKNFIETFNGFAEEEGVGHDYIYMNYAASFQDPLGNYGAVELKRLRDVARKYDPTGVFQKQVPGGFKIV